MFKIHYYSNDMTVLEISLNDEFGKESVDLTQNNAAQTTSDSENGDSAKSSEETTSSKSSGTDGEEAASEQDYAKLYKQDAIRYLLVPEDKTDQIPAVYDFIGNAGFIPKDHWVHDEAAGGGRILGEACHFVDLIQYLDGSHLEDLTVTAASNNAYPMNDNVLITLRFASGAIGNIVYSSMGSKKYPKEQLRVLSNGSVYEMDNFIRLKKYGSTKSVKEKLKQDKGIHAEYEYICKVLRGQEKNTVIADAFRGQELLIKAMQKVKES